MNSQEASSTILSASEFKDKQIRYSFTCLQDGALRLDVDSIDLVKELKNENLRFSSATSIAYYAKKNPTKIQTVISDLTSILKKNSNQYESSPILNKILKLKNIDIRRSAAYALGKIGNVLNTEEKYPNLKGKIVDILQSVVDDKTDNIEIRWMAAASLQMTGIKMDQFFIEKKLVNPATIKCQFPNGLSHWLAYKSRTSGLAFDIYSGECFYDNRIGCGEGLAEIYNTLRRLLSR